MVRRLHSRQVVPPHAHRRPSYRPPGQARAGAFVLASVAGATVGLGVVAGSLAARTVAAPRGADWIATAVPWLAVVAAAAVAVAVHRWRKISERAPTVTVAALAALPALLAAQLARLLEVAAVAPQSALAGGDWSPAASWLSSVALEDVVAAAPGLRRVSETLGAQATWIALACEAVVLSAVMLVAVDLALAAPLCGACRRWCRHRYGVAGSAADAPIEQLEERARARDWLFFRALGRPRSRRIVRFDLITCPTPDCDRASAVSLYLMRPFMPDRALVVNLRVGPDDVRTILAMRPRRPSGRSRVPGTATL